MHAVRWGSRAWRRNLDETVADPEHPQAFPARHPTDLMGRIRVRLCAGDGGLVAYGFGGQRIALPAAAVWDVITVDAYRTGPVARGEPLPLDAADPAGTREFVTVVYLTGDPGVAAAQQQLAGSVWHGAPTANEITGILFTLALPPLIWFLIFRIRRHRWLRDAGLRDLAVAAPR